jgi:hypothetical protein
MEIAEWIVFGGLGCVFFLAAMAAVIGDVLLDFFPE